MVPESLLDYKDFNQWILCEDTKSIRNASFSPQDKKEFDVLSNQAWIHLLMQIIKVHLLTCTLVGISTDYVCFYYYNEGAGTTTCDQSCARIS